MLTKRLWSANFFNRKDFAVKNQKKHFTPDCYEVPTLETTSKNAKQTFPSRELHQNQFFPVNVQHKSSCVSCYYRNNKVH